MKAKLPIILLLVLPYFTLAQDNYKIEANIPSLENDSKVFLIYNQGDRFVTDSTYVKEGMFHFEGTISYPVMASLFLHKNPYSEKLEKGEMIDYHRFYLDGSVIQMDAEDSLKDIEILGSFGINHDYAIQQAMQRPINQKFDELNNEFFALSPDEQSDSTNLAHYTSRELLIMDESYSRHLDFAELKPNSYLSLISLSFAAGRPKFEQRTREVYATISDQLRNTPLGREIALQIESIGKTNIGAKAPELSLVTLNGEVVHISDYNGKYLLIDFWASWCVPCREENPNLIEAYARFKDQNFDILGISLDNANQKDALHKAIDQDQLQWTQTADFKGWNSHAAKIYGINSIPSNFLLDPEGKIVAKNLRGVELQHFLEELFTP